MIDVAPILAVSQRPLLVNLCCNPHLVADHHVPSKEITRPNHIRFQRSAGNPLVTSERPDGATLLPDEDFFSIDLGIWLHHHPQQTSGDPRRHNGLPDRHPSQEHRG